MSVSKIVWLFICLLVAAGLGYLLGERSAVPKPAVQDEFLASSSPLEYRLQGILLEMDTKVRTQQLMAFFEDLEPDNARVVVGTYDRLFPFVDEVAVTLFADWWARADPEASVARFPKGFAMHKDLALKTIMRRWGQDDPIVAMERLNEIGPGYAFESGLFPLVEGWVNSGDDSIWQYVEAMGIGPRRQQVMATVVEQLVFRRGSEAAIRIVEAIPDDAENNFKLQFFRRLAGALAILDPEKASLWAERHRGSPFGEGLIRHVVARWGARQPSLAMSWVAGLPADKEQAEALSLAFGMWARRDREAAMEWVRRAGYSPEIDSLWAAYAVMVGRDDPAAGLSLVEQVMDEDDRNRDLVRIAIEWMQQDPAAAQIWLDEAEVDPVLRERILNPALLKRSRGRN